MKKILLTLICLAVVGTAAQAQLFKAGIKVGANYAKLKPKEKLFESDNKAGFQAGLWARVGALGFHVQPEAYFTSKSSKVTFGAATQESGDVKFNNVDVPILLGKRFGIGPLGARVQAGPLFSFVMDKKNDLANQQAVSDYKDKFQAIVGGVGVDISKLSVDLRYEHGLGNIHKTAAGKQNLNLLSLSVGISLF